jgi:hypothetical protein
MTFDPSRNTCVLFGGDSLSGLRNDLWAWNGLNWQAISTSIPPAPRRDASLAFNPRWGGCVLFGGELNGSRASDISVLRGNQ